MDFYISLPQYYVVKSYFIYLLCCNPCHCAILILLLAIPDDFTCQQEVLQFTGITIHSAILYDM